MRRIETEADLAEGAAALAQLEPRFGPVLAATGPLPLMRKPQGFGALAFAIIGQQVSTRSAAAIWARFQAAGLDDPSVMTEAPDAVLIEVGLTRPKQAYLRALAASGQDYGALARMEPEEAVASLCRHKGIGRWTAEIYAMQALGLADVFAPGDLALQEGVRLIWKLPERPSERALDQMARSWAPWRAIAARAIWVYYLAAKGRQEQL
ncbi:MAG: DNA-3-methyladenine glycosylase 2 family protein [Pseudomonadota bacterium]